MKLGVIGGLGADWREGVERIRIAEDLGYEYATAGEAWNASILPFLTLAAANTERIRLGTSILNCYSRTPAALAQEFVALDQISNGRMVLGLGSSGANVIEHFHGLPFEKPLQRMREAVEIFGTLIAGQKLDYDGEIFQLRRGFQMNDPHPSSKIPVWIAAISPKSIRQTGEIAASVPESWRLHWSSRCWGRRCTQMSCVRRSPSRRSPHAWGRPATC